MTPLLFVLAAAAGAVGRLAVGTVVCTWRALLVVNTVGAAVLGYVAQSDASPATSTVVGVGLCGALTTYSSFALETRSLRWKYGSAYAVITLVCVCSAASLASTFA